MRNPARSRIDEMRDASRTDWPPTRVPRQEGHTLHRAGTRVVVTGVHHQDPCWQLAGAHVFGVSPEGEIIGGLVVELSCDAVRNDDGSFMVDGVQAVDNARFGAFIGAFEADPPEHHSKVEDFLHQTLGDASGPPADDPFDSRERRRSVAGDPVCFTHAVIRPHLQVV